MGGESSSGYVRTLKIEKTEQKYFVNEIQCILLVFPTQWCRSLRRKLKKRRRNELRRERGSQARSYFETAQRLCPQIYEAQYNGALLSYRKGEFEISHSQLKSSLGAYPEHVDSGVLMNRLRKLLSEGT